MMKGIYVLYIHSYVEKMCRRKKSFSQTTVLNNDRAYTALSTTILRTLKFNKNSTYRSVFSTSRFFYIILIQILRITV